MELLGYKDITLRNQVPVSLTCVPCKLLEHIVCSNIMAHLDEYKLLSDSQKLQVI